MLLHYPKVARFFTPLFVLLLSTGVPAQMIILQQDFEGAASDDFAFGTDPDPYTVGDDVWDVVTSFPGITAAASGTNFWGMRDLENNNGGGAMRHILDFDAGTVCALTGAAFVFEYNVFEFDGGDDLGYTLFVDGFEVADVTIVDGSGNFSTGGWVTETVSIPASATTARLEIWAEQNGAGDYAGVDNVRLQAAGTGGTCTPTCGISADDNDVSFLCQALTAGADGVTAVIAYSGADLDASVSASAGSVGGDNPAVTPNGEITVAGLSEGQSATLSITGGGCSISINISPPANQCEPGDVIINEFRWATTSQEFVEVVNVAGGPIDVTGYTIEDATGNQVNFPAITLQPEDGIVFANDPSAVSGGCTIESITPIGLNNGGDVIIVRDGSGRIVDQVSYDGSEAPSGVSLARTPDADPNGVFEPHTDVDPAGSSASPCYENERPAVGLPVELLSLDARPTAKTVVLTWSTASEVANDRFVVERSRAGQNWESVGTVRANGRSGADYELTDDNPLDGRSYYRLRQVDLDGTFALFGPVAVRFATAELAVFPNPAGAELQLNREIDDAQAQLLTPAGRLLGIRPINAGRMDLTGLRPGLYLLRVGNETVRFVKQ